MFTSGTTGKPKGVMTGHAQNIRSFDTWSRTVGLTCRRQLPDHQPLLPLLRLQGRLARGDHPRRDRILPVAVFDVAEVLRRIQFERVSMLPGPPTIYQSLLAHPEAVRNTTLSSLRLAVTGAAPTPVDLIHRMRSELGFRSVIKAYGLTETCGVVTICLPTDEPEPSRHRGARDPGHRGDLVDAAGEPVPAGSPARSGCAATT
jgi:acyl-coenzyme A synthetase/AMP-(fatty) acid ligase